jgi:hypothetical protein
VTQTPNANANKIKKKNKQSTKHNTIVQVLLGEKNFFLNEQQDPDPGPGI